MTDIPKEPPTAAPALDGGEGVAAESAGPRPASAAADSDQVSQADVDALISAAAGVPAQETGAAIDAETPSVDEATTDSGLGSADRPFGEMAAAMQAAIDGEATGQDVPAMKSLQLPDFGGAELADVDAKRVSMLSDVDLDVKIELGRTHMLVEEVLKLGEGSVVELNKLAGDPVDVFANGRLIARGEVLVLNDSFCVRISEVFSDDPHRVSK